MNNSLDQQKEFALFFIDVLLMVTFSMAMLGAILWLIDRIKNGMK